MPDTFFYLLRALQAMHFGCFSLLEIPDRVGLEFLSSKLFLADVA